MSKIDIQKIIECIQPLQQLWEELLDDDLPPEGAWIHEYEITRFYPSSGNTEWCRYAKWQAHEPIFKRSPRQIFHRAIFIELLVSLWQLRTDWNH